MFKEPRKEHGGQEPASALLFFSQQVSNLLGTASTTSMGAPASTLQAPKEEHFPNDLEDATRAKGYKNDSRATLIWFEKHKGHGK